MATSEKEVLSYGIAAAIECLLGITNDVGYIRTNTQKEEAHLRIKQYLEEYSVERILESALFYGKEYTYQRIVEYMEKNR